MNMNNNIMIKSRVIPFHRVTRKRGRIHIGRGVSEIEDGGTWIQAATTGETMVWRKWRPAQVFRSAGWADLAGRLV